MNESDKLKRKWIK